MPCAVRVRLQCTDALENHCAAHAFMMARPIGLDRTKKAPAFRCRQCQRSEASASCGQPRRAPS
eukprot:207644-Prymnesium_polylepis.1